MIARLLAFLRRWPSTGSSVGGSIGERGERLAEARLVAEGHRVLARNLRLPGGELDLIVERPPDPTVIIVEVKTSAGAPSEKFKPERRVNARKRRKLILLSKAARAKYPELRGRPIRFDILAVELQGGKKPPTLRHFPGAFRASFRAY